MSEVSESVPLIYTSTEILSWSNPVDPLEQALSQIIKEMKKDKTYIDRSEYLFIVSFESPFADAIVEVFENYADKQLLINAYEINYETGAIEIIENN